nr:zinc finger, CCHC-type [Tanacetum cinerariifolium]
MKSGTSSCPCDATGAKDSVCLASRAGASLDYERFSLLHVGRRANYNMHSMGKRVNELHAMLKLHEQTLPKSNAPALHAIRAESWEGENKQAYATKPKIPPPPKRENPAKDSICHECGEIGNWKRNCPQYLAELMKKKKNATSGAGGSGRIFLIDGLINHYSDSRLNWRASNVFQTGCTFVHPVLHSLLAINVPYVENLRIFLIDGLINHYSDSRLNWRASNVFQTGCTFVHPVLHSLLAINVPYVENL